MAEAARHLWGERREKGTSFPRAGESQPQPRRNQTGYYLKSLLVQIDGDPAPFGSSLGGSLRLEGFLVWRSDGRHTPVTETVTMLFRIYDDEYAEPSSARTGGGPFQVRVADGKFDAVLRFDNFVRHGFLECEVDGQTVRPRVLI